MVNLLNLDLANDKNLPENDFPHLQCVLKIREFFLTINIMMLL